MFSWNVYKIAMEMSCNHTLKSYSPCPTYEYLIELVKWDEGSRTITYLVGRREGVIYYLNTYSYKSNIKIYVLYPTDIAG